LLCTGVPVVGRLQAKRERRRGLQVPKRVIEASTNIIRKTGSKPYVSCLVSVPRGEGDHLPFIDQGEGDVQAGRTIQLRVEVWRTVPWR
jgi:hypothetical protein